MMEIVLSAAASPRFSQDSSVAGHKGSYVYTPSQDQREILGKCLNCLQSSNVVRDKSKC